MEVFSPPRVTARAAKFPKFGVLPGGAFDLRPGPDGRVWNFDRAGDRAEAERRIEQSQPYLLIGSPPCTDWSSFNIRLNHKRMDPREVADRRRRARVHLEFVAKLYLKQLARGAHFLHEHPASADSWETDVMIKVLSKPGVNSVVGHMCRQGMRIQAPDGRELPVRKPTRWASSAPEVLRRLGARCTNEGLRPGGPGWHDHTALEGRPFALRRPRRTRRPCAPTFCGASRPRGLGRAIPCRKWSGKDWMRAVPCTASTRNVMPATPRRDTTAMSTVCQQVDLLGAGLFLFAGTSA